jgi:hypothetical protein
MGRMPRRHTRASGRNTRRASGYNKQMAGSNTWDLAAEPAILAQPAAGPSGSRPFLTCLAAARLGGRPGRCRGPPEAMPATFRVPQPGSVLPLFRSSGTASGRSRSPWRPDRAGVVAGLAPCDRLLFDGSRFRARRVLPIRARRRRRNAVPCRGRRLFRRW